MKDPLAHTSLRLVGGSVAQPLQALPRSHIARTGIGAVRSLAARHAAGGAAPSLAQRRAVEAENKAATMSALDPRWALAVRTSSMLQGGRAAILPPESRRFLVKLGKDINLRPFDSNLVIAIVQDAARAGCDPIGAESRMRLKMVREPVPAQDRPTVRWVIGAVGLGAVGLWFLIRVFGA
ncbi:MAG: hypothetical protein Q8L55_07610 [Phycisphaerales bacterium]|nr:hypothetical protein [Phycisphaerales bacterium]